MGRPPVDELISVFQAMVAAEGTTTGAGAATGDSFIDAALIGAGANSYVGMTAVLFPGDADSVDSVVTTTFNNATGEVGLAGAYKGVAAAIPAGTKYKIINFKALPSGALTQLQDVFDLVNAILITTETGATITSTAAVQDMYVNNAPFGVYKPILLKVDMSTMLAGDGIVIRVLGRISPLGGLVLQSEQQFNGAQDPPMKLITLHPNRYGIQTTILRIAGIDRDYTWEVVMDD